MPYAEPSKNNGLAKEDYSPITEDRSPANPVSQKKTPPNVSVLGNTTIHIVKDGKLKFPASAN